MEPLVLNGREVAKKLEEELKEKVCFLKKKSKKMLRLLLLLLVRMRQVKHMLG